MKKFSVYVAAAAAGNELDRVHMAISSLKAHGFTVTCSWPEIVEQVGDANPRDASALERRGWSTTDLDEVVAADAVWFLVPSPPVTTRGAWLEAGYAYATDKHLVFSGDTKQSIFCALGHEFETDTMALAFLRELAAEGERRGA